jgi:succinoglycan biosynthesis protein ExoA
VGTRAGSGPRAAHGSSLITDASIAVVVPCRNEARTLPALLDAIERQTRRPHEIIIVDDRSTDGTPAAVEAWRRARPGRSVRVMAGEGRGAGPAMNRGIEAATADVIVRLDGHCRPDPRYIELSLETLARHGAGISGGVWQIEPGANTLAARGIACVLSHPLGSGGADYRHAQAGGDARDVDTVPFGTFPRALWSELGGFDERLLRNQDYDFNYRARLAGHRVVLNPAIVSVYRARPAFGALARQYFGYGYWKIVMLRKFPASLRLRQLLPLAAVFAIAALMVLGALTGARWPWLLIASYVALDVAGGAHASSRAGHLQLLPVAALALLTLQLSWGLGAWSAVLRGARVR